MRMHVTLCLLLVLTTATIGLAAVISRLPAPPPVSGTSADPAGTAELPGQRGWLHPWSPQKLSGTRVVSRRSENVVNVPRVARQVYFDPLPEYLVSAAPEFLVSAVTEGQRGSHVPQRPLAIQMQRVQQRPQAIQMQQVPQRPQAIQMRQVPWRPQAIQMQRVPQRQQAIQMQQVPRRPQAIQMQQVPQLSQPTDAAANYKFEYEVKHLPSGVDFGHREQRDGLLTTGRYHVMLPDGRLQVVDYSANRTGYMANVQYIAQPQGTQQPQQQEQQQQQQQQQQQY